MPQADDEDSRIAQRIRLTLLDALNMHEEVQKRLDKECTPTAELRKSIVGVKGEVFAVAVLGCLLAAILPLVAVLLLQYLLDMSENAARLIFWSTWLLLSTISVAQVVRSLIAEKALYWARLEERASRTARAYLALLDDLDLEFPGSLPDLSRYRNYDLDGETPLVDAAMKGVGQ